MILYILFIITIWIIALTDFDNSNHKKKLYIIFPIFILFAGLRWNCGFDWDMYYSYFIEKHAFSWKYIFQHEQFEPLFILLYELAPTFTIFFLFYLTIIYTFSYKLYLKRSYYPIFSLWIFCTLFYCLCFMGQMRQGMAITITCFSLYFFPNRKKMLICYAIASMFHISALITLFFVLVPTKIPKLRTLILLMLILISFSQLFYNNISLIVSLLPSFGSAKVVYYATKYQPGATLSFSLIVYKIIVYCLLRYSVIKKQLNPNIGYINFVTNLYSYSIPLFILLSFEPTIAGRIDYYFMALEPIIISYIIFNATKNKKLIYILFFSSIYFYQYINTLNTFKSDFIPYKNIFL